MNNPGLERPRRPRAGLDSSSFAAVAIVCELLLIPAAWALAWIWPGEEVAPAKWRFDHASLAALFTLPLVAFLALVTWTPLREVKPVRRIRVLFRRRFGSTLAGLRLWQILSISIAAGLGEEVLFRGVLQSRIHLVGASLLFGALHCITPTYLVFATLMGLYLGRLFEHWNSLLIPIIVHALYDAVALLVIRRELRKEKAYSSS